VSGSVSGNGLYLGRQLVQAQLLELDLFARVVDVNTNKVSVGIIVHHDPFRNFAALDTRLFGEVNVQGIRVDVVIHPNVA
jgi:hypothetical protein